MTEDDIDAAWGDAERSEHWRREDEALERSKVLTAQAQGEFEAFEAACKRFQAFMLEYEQATFRRNFS